MIIEEEETANFMDVLELRQRIYWYVIHSKSEKDDFEKAIELATNFSIEKSLSSECLLGISSFYVQKKSYILAYIFAKAAANISTGDTKGTAHYNAGIISVMMGHKEEAEKQYKMALAVNPNDTDAHINYGVLLADVGKKDEAERQYKLALEASPKNITAHQNYGILLKDMGRKQEAQKEFTLAVELNPKDTNIYFNYGLFLNELGIKERVEEQYKLAIELDPKNVLAHMNYGNFLIDMKREKEAEEQYILALKTEPDHADTHYNYGVFLQQVGRKKEAEEHYILALKTEPKNMKSHYNYGLLLQQAGRKEEAKIHYKLVLEDKNKPQEIHLNYGALLQDMDCWEEAEYQYKLALKTDSENVKTHLNYAILLTNIGRWKEAEEQYTLALESDPTDIDVHQGYGVLLAEMGCWKEAEKQYKIAIDLDPERPIIHSAYGLLFSYQNLEGRAIKETKLASDLFRKEGDNVKEHLSLAWLYEILADKYYNLQDYQKSGDYADISGVEYIEASKYSEEKIKSVSLTKGYTLKGRAKIRKIKTENFFYKDIVQKTLKKNSYEITKFTKIIDCVMDASRYYAKAAEVSPKGNQLCNACSISMLCLSEMLDYMLAVIKQEKTPNLEDKLKDWNERIKIAENVYQNNSKGKLFIESLSKLMGCIQNLDKYKRHGTREYGRSFEECYKELSEIANNIEGPLQKIIEDSAKQMDLCRLKIIPYAGSETGYMTKPNKLSQFSKWILDPKRIITGISGLILTIVISHYNEDLFSLIQAFVSMFLN